MTNSPNSISAVWTKPVADELRRVEARLRTFVPAKVPIVEAAFASAVSAGGKRLRPALCLLAAGVVGEDCLQNETVISAATIVEVIHLASLMHDDVVDEADLRRGAEATRMRWGNRASVLVGDYLAAQAYRVLSEDVGDWATQLVCTAVVEMCEGQFAHAAHHGDLSEDEYLAIIRGKTGALFRVACEMGGRAGGASESVAQHLASYGMNLGIAFQIVDDLLDLYAPAAETGKPACNDLRTGQYTLPITTALKSERGAELQALLEADEADHLNAEELQRIAALADELGGRAYAASRATQFAQAAASDLAGLPASKYRDALTAACDDVLSRIP